MGHSEHVDVNREAARRLAGELVEEYDFECASWDGPMYPSLDDTTIEDVVDFIMVGNSVNYCFNDLETGAKYKTEFLGTEWRGAVAMYAALKKAYDDNTPILDAEYLRTITRSEVERVFQPSTDVALPMIETRVKQLRRIGELMNEHDGSFATLFEDQVTLYGDDGVVESLASTDVFRDQRRYNGETVRFDKRPQLTVSMLYGKLLDTPHEFSITDMDAFTVFADYGIPAGLVTQGVLEYSERLTTTIANHDTIPENAPEEVEIRAGTVVAGDTIKRFIRDVHDCDVTVPALDFVLWQMRRDRDTNVHLTATTAY
jgi:hypothetical protein